MERTFAAADVNGDFGAAAGCDIVKGETREQRPWWWSERKLPAGYSSHDDSSLDRAHTGLAARGNELLTRDIPGDAPGTRSRVADQSLGTVPS